MKKLTLIFTLVFTVMFSSKSFAEWTKVDENEVGTTFYVDFESIKKNEGFVYYWLLTDLWEPHKETGVMSGKTLYEVDCNIPFRERKIFANYYLQPMGNGAIELKSPHKGDWVYPSPNSSGENIINQVCSRSKR